MAFSQSQNSWKILCCLGILILLCLCNYLFRRSKRAFFYIKHHFFLLSPLRFYSLFSSFTSYIRHIVATFYVVTTDLGFESTTLSLLFGILILHLLFISLIRFFFLQEFNCLDFDFFLVTFNFLNEILDDW
jgi:membrane-associated HD superfamily phosphohydrolase